MVGTHAEEPVEPDGGIITDVNSVMNLLKGMKLFLTGPWRAQRPYSKNEEGTGV